MPSRRDPDLGIGEILCESSLRTGIGGLSAAESEEPTIAQTGSYEWRAKALAVAASGSAP